MTHDAKPMEIMDPQPVDASVSLVGRIAGCRAGLLSGSAISTDRAAPSSLLVAADGRTIGEAAMTWESSATRTNGAAAVYRGTWSFDARHLPPSLLLDDRITFAIRARHDEGPLDTMDVASAQLSSVADLRPRAGRLAGFIDGTENGTVRGWVCDPADPARRLTIALFIAGRFCGTYVADHPRPDLAAIGRGDGRYGFAIAAQAFYERETSRAPKTQITKHVTTQVVTLAPEAWAVPLAPHLRRRPWRFAVPHPRAVAATTRELVALLTSPEPLAKKIHVIDRSVRRMPDAFAADYVLLAVEFLRIEMLKSPSSPPANWRERLVAWWRRRLVHRQMRRLTTVANAIAASQTLLNLPQGATTSLGARNTHERP